MIRGERAEPKEIDGRRTEAHRRAQQVPMGEMHENLGHVRILVNG